MVSNEIQSGWPALMRRCEDCPRHHRLFASVEEHFSVLLCRKPKGWTLDQIWPRLKSRH